MRAHVRSHLITRVRQVVGTGYIRRQRRRNEMRRMASQSTPGLASETDREVCTGRKSSSSSSHHRADGRAVHAGRHRTGLCGPPGLRLRCSRAPC
jgi:hypothetical protein